MQVWSCLAGNMSHAPKNSNGLNFSCSSFWAPNKQTNFNCRIKMGKSGHSAAEALLALSKPCKFGLAWRESFAMRSVSLQRQGKSLDVGAALGLQNKLYFQQGRNTLSKEVQIVYRLFLLNSYLLHVPIGFLPSQLATWKV